MSELQELLAHLPQKAPVGFVKEILHVGEHESRTVVEFEVTPTLGMLSEAGAQSSVFLKLTEEKKAINIPDRTNGMLLSVKSKWYQRSDKRRFEIESHYISNLDNFFMLSFSVLDGGTLIADGQLSVVLQKEGQSL